MAETLQFELVSPEKLLLSEPVGMVVVPGTEGNFGVLPGHALFISTVRPGVIDVYEDGKTVSERIFVSGGFAEVTPERCTVLADEAMPLSSLDRGTIESEMRTLESTAAASRTRSSALPARSAKPQWCTSPRRSANSRWRRRSAKRRGRARIRDAKANRGWIKFGAAFETAALGDDMRSPLRLRKLSGEVSLSTPRR